MKDIIIIGGGLAGLINAIVLSKAGLKVLLIEKHEYPFHKVCGEYVSNETLPYLRSLGVDPFLYGAVALDRFRLSSPAGTVFESKLDLGGFGISRYLLDYILAEKATECGAEIHSKENVLQVNPSQQDGKTIYHIKTDTQEYEAPVVIGSFGKRSNLDQSLSRAFFRKRSPYLGVKYHLKLKKTNLLPHPENLIALHNFKDGYCGISRIEEDKFCLCYLTTRKNLKEYQSIEQMEAVLLSKNKFLEDIFQHAEMIYDKPKVINEISFAPKSLIENGILMCGDTAGMIAPLCGNGMAMAIHSGKILSGLLVKHFNGSIHRQSLEESYQKQWNRLFKRRLWMGRNVQSMFGNPSLTELLVRTANLIPAIGQLIIKNTHGKEF